ncbi:F-box protein PP2-B10-like [Mercurialis annua]|uniref:F-box protein PP2-B10-like n=1 Tax=Mercurialis annua TaxID=3986 RepID=UPI00215E2511|nr:F-box protein PP2-B10-like [Mercurialis annua]
MGANDGDDEPEMHVLPEGCVANVLSFTGPRDAGRLSLVSSTFKSASESDAVWEHYLPNDYRSIVSSSSDSSHLLAGANSKKELYLRLCDAPILIDDGRKSFSLDKFSGKKCYMLAARDLMIVWGDTPRYWRWTSELKSRFDEVAELIGVCWLEICGKINVRMLSPDTLYGAYFVFKTTAGAYGFDQPVDVTVGLAGTEGRRRSVYLDVEGDRQQHYQIVVRRVGIFNHSRAVGLQAPLPTTREKNDDDHPKEREDGWSEIEMGEFFVNGDDDGDFEMKILEVNGGNWKGGLITQGIEIRPKY